MGVRFSQVYSVLVGGDQKDTNSESRPTFANRRRQKHYGGRGSPTARQGGQHEFARINRSERSERRVGRMNGAKAKPRTKWAAFQEKWFWSPLLPATPGCSRGVTEPAGPAGSSRDLIPGFAGRSRELVPKCTVTGREIGDGRWKMGRPGGKTVSARMCK